jgi:manganese/zinc/iron transport system permease protein
MGASPGDIMNSFQIIIMAIACLTSIATVLPGVFLVLRGVALMSDAISHAILPGIVLMFFLVHNLESPLLILGAALAGIATVLITEKIIASKRLKKDSAIGIVFPLFFSVGIILISMYARNVHLDMDMVLLGELAFAPFNRLEMFGIDWGPRALWSMGTIALLNSLFVLICYKELQLSTFDPELSRMLGFTPAYMYYALMTLTSITAVGAFNVVGSIVVVALMITPPATAYLLTNHLHIMIYNSIALGITSSIGGYWLSHILNVSIAGAIATMSGILFLCALLFAPEKGLIASYLFNRRNKRAIAQQLLRTYLCAQPAQRASLTAIATNLGFKPAYVKELTLNQDLYVIIMHNDESHVMIFK